MNPNQVYGIVGYLAPELDIPLWIDANGEKTTPVKLSNFDGKFKVIFCFQSWCPGCHSRGFPALKEMVEALEGNENVVFIAVQTVFEGFEENTYEKMVETQKQYGLKIPFGQDEGTKLTSNSSSVMYNYRNGGTPWFIFIDQNNNVVFNDFHLDTHKSIEFLKSN